MRRRAITLLTTIAIITPAALVTLASPAAASSVPGTPGTPNAVGMQNAAALRWTAPSDAGSPPLTQYRVEANSGAGWSTAATTKGAQGLTSGNRFTCALLHTGAVKCWGDNGNGELGLGDTAHRGDGAGEMGDNLPAVNLGTGRTAVALTGGDFHTCALLDNGSVKCWGWNVNAQLGLGDTASRGDNASEMGDNLPAVNLGTGRTAVAIDGGGDDTCALLDDGTVKCWGNNSSGQLGQGNTTSRGDSGAVGHEMGDSLPAINLGTGRTAVAVAASNNGFVCALLDNASVKCWGNNSAGQLGLGNTTNRGSSAGQMGDSLPAVNLGTGRTATAIAAGADHTCAILDNATTKCWGFNTSGQLGLGDATSRGDSGSAGHLMGDSLPAVDLGSGRTATAISAGANSTCARLDDATVKCWGNNDLGQLGQGNTTKRGDSGAVGHEMGNSLPAVDLGTGRTAAALATGGNHTCVLLDDATVKCWGYNGFGQLGKGDTANLGDGGSEMGNNLPAVALGTVRSVTQITGGASYTCALLDDGTVKCWGGNDLGQLGLGDTNNRGDNGGEMADNLPAVDLGGGHTATAISAGGNHTCAILDNGTVKCWGFNGQGQLGLGDTNNRGDNGGEMGASLPAVDLGGGHTATAISAGAQHTCAILDDGTVKCWGRNDEGELGLGNTTRRGDSNAVGHEMGASLPAVDLGSGRTATALTAGGFHTCALLDNASVKCWGKNDLGQLGQGNTTSRGDSGTAGHEMGNSLPAVDLGGGHTATAITAGTAHTCALLDNGTVKCWAFNNDGELGLGDTFTRGDNGGEMGASLPAVVLGANATAISAGEFHTCARLDTGSVKCWGDNVVGQLGQGDTNNRGDNAGEMSALSPVSLGTGHTALAVMGGHGSHTCAVLDNAVVKCWGYNGFGGLGYGDTTQRGDNAGEMGTNLPVVSLSGPLFGAPARSAVVRLAANSYQLRVVAVNSVGDSSPSAASSSVTVTGVGAPGAPTGVSGAAGNAQVSLSWTAPPNGGFSPITDYEVTVYDGSGGTPTGVTGATTRLVGSATTNLVFTGLTNDTPYTFKVAAVNSVGTGAQSALSATVSPASFTVPASVGDPNGYDTGFAANNSVTMRALGTWCYAVAQCTDPNGTGPVGGGGYLEPTVTTFALVGRIGTSGSWTKIGTGPVTLHGIGELYLAMNDLTGSGYTDNSGSVSVDVVADLNLSQSYTSAGPVMAGPDVGWQATAANNGTTTLTNVTFIVSPAFNNSQQISDVPTWKSNTSGIPTPCPLVPAPNSAPNLYYCAIPSFAAGDTVDISTTVHTLGVSPQTLGNAFVLNFSDQTGSCSSEIQCSTGFPVALPTSLVVDGLIFHVTAPATVEAGTSLHISGYAENTGDTGITKIATFATIDKGSVTLATNCSFQNNSPLGTGAKDRCPDPSLGTFDLPANSDSSTTPGSVDINTTGLQGKTINYTVVGTSPDIGGNSQVQTGSIFVAAPAGGIAIETPANNATLAGSAANDFTAVPTPNLGDTVTSVDLQLDTDTPINVTAPPYTTQFPANSLPAGTHTLKATMHQLSGPDAFTSITVKVAAAPSVTIVQPVGFPPGSSLTAAKSFTATATPGTGATVKSVVWQIDGTIAAPSAAASPYTATVDPAKLVLAQGSHTITATATDSVAQTTTSATFSFTVPTATLTMGTTTRLADSVTPGTNAAWTVTVNNSVAATARHVAITFTAIATDTMSVQTPLSFDTAAINGALHVAPSTSTCEKAADGISLVCTVPDLGAGGMSVQFPLFAFTGGVSLGSTITATAVAQAANSAATAEQHLGAVTVDSCGTNCVKGVAAAGTAFKNNSNANNLISVNLSKGLQSTVHGVKFGRPFKRATVDKLHRRVTLRPRLDTNPSVVITLDSYASGDSPTSPDAAMDASLCALPSPCLGDISKVDGDFSPYTNKADPVVVVIVARWGTTVPPGHIWMQKPPPLAHPDQIPMPIQLPACTINTTTRAFNTPCVLPEITKTLTVNSITTKTTYSTVLFTGNDPHMARR